MPKNENELRTLDKVTALDPRNLPAWPLEKAHALLRSLQLKDKVPDRVREIFETAKNLSLYACFVNEFHGTACLTASVALEVAIKQKWRAVYKREPDTEHQMLKALLDHAVTENWIRIEAFSWARSNAEYYAKHNAMVAHHEEHPEGGFDPPDVNEAMIDRELANYGSWIVEWAKVAKQLRNDHAHGTIRPDVYLSYGPLELVADAINGMFD